MWDLRDGSVQIENYCGKTTLSFHATLCLARRPSQRIAALPKRPVSRGVARLGAAGFSDRWISCWECDLAGRLGAAADRTCGWLVDASGQTDCFGWSWYLRALGLYRQKMPVPRNGGMFVRGCNIGRV